jgi:hypothetical protein
MKLTLDLPPKLEQELARQAACADMSPNHYALAILCRTPRSEEGSGETKIDRPATRASRRRPQGLAVKVVIIGPAFDDPLPTAVLEKFGMRGSDS